MPLRLEVFRPQLRISFTYIHRPCEFSLTGVHSLLRVTDPESPPLGRTFNLMSGRVAPVCSPRYLERTQHRGVAPRALASMDLLHALDKGDWISWFKKAGVGTIRLRPGNIFEDFGLLSSALLFGQGVGLCPVELFAEDIARGNVIQLSDISLHDDRMYAPYSPSTRHPKPSSFANG